MSRVNLWILVMPFLERTMWIKTTRQIKNHYIKLKLHIYKYLLTITPHWTVAFTSL